MNRLSFCANNRKMIMLLGMFFMLTMCSLIAACTGISSSSCDCKLKIGNTQIYEGPAQLSCLSGTYVSDKDPSSKLVFKPDCKVTFNMNSQTKEYYYQTKAFQIVVSSDPNAVPGLSDATALSTSDDGKIVYIQGESFKKQL